MSAISKKTGKKRGNKKKQYKPAPQTTSDILTAVRQRAIELPEPEHHTTVDTQTADGTTVQALQNAAALKHLDTLLHTATQRADRDELWQIYRALARLIADKEHTNRNHTIWNLHELPTQDTTPAPDHIETTDKRYSDALDQILGRHLNANLLYGMSHEPTGSLDTHEKAGISDTQLHVMRTATRRPLEDGETPAANEGEVPIELRQKMMEEDQQRTFGTPAPRIEGEQPPEHSGEELKTDISKLVHFFTANGMYFNVFQAWLQLSKITSDFKDTRERQAVIDIEDLGKRYRITSVDPIIELLTELEPHFDGSAFRKATGRQKVSPFSKRCLLDEFDPRRRFSEEIWNEMQLEEMTLTLNDQTYEFSMEPFQNVPVCDPHCDDCRYYRENPDAMYLA